MRKPEEIQFVIASFTREQFELLKTVAGDRDALDDTYEDWRRNVDNLKSQLSENGSVVVEVSVSVAEIEDHCRRYGLENIGPTRAKYVCDKMKAISMGIT